MHMPKMYVHAMQKVKRSSVITVHYVAAAIICLGRHARLRSRHLTTNDRTSRAAAFT